MTPPPPREEVSPAPGRSATPQPRPRRRRGKNLRGRPIAVLPTMFTLGNLLCGFMAVFVASRPIDTPMVFDWTPLTCAALFIFVGQIADALDGRVARLTRSTSDLGEQLDSMADMVTFGVAPARKLFDLFSQLDGVTDPAELVRLSALHEVDFLHPPEDA